ncbi:MAG: hypothetical protein HY236_09560, partial [Acidobacteria bacterium]|nr:hypothetical protein [Acidobacteriota bacterium]
MPLRRILALILFLEVFRPPVTPALWRAPDNAEGGIYFVSLEGDDANPGTRQQPWRRIEWAMTRPFLRGGDTIRIRGGVYRPLAEPDSRRHNSTP